MDSWLMVLSADNIFQAQGAKTGLLIGLGVGSVLTMLVGFGGILLTRKTGSPRVGMLIQLVPLAIGLCSATAGLVLMLLQEIPPVSSGLLAGGLLAVVESGVFMFVCVADWRQHQRPNREDARE